MKQDVHEYYDTEFNDGLWFVAYGAVSAVSGAISLSRDGDFEKGYGWSTLILGGLTALGGAGYSLTVVPRREHFTALFERDPAKFKTEEAEHIAGTNSRFVLYLGGEAAETLAGIGIATYGFIKDKDLYKGAGIGVALEGIGLLLIDGPGAVRAARYQNEVRRFNPSVALSIGGGLRPWGVQVGHRF